MKTIRNPLLWLTLGALLLVAAAFNSGCATTIKPGSDPIVVRAEQSAETALAVFDSYLKWERRNQAVVGADAHQLADDIRTQGKSWIQDLRTATKNYKAARTGDNLDKLRFSQQMLELALNEITKYTKP